MLLLPTQQEEERGQIVSFFRESTKRRKKVKMRVEHESQRRKETQVHQPKFCGSTLSGVVSL